MCIGRNDGRLQEGNWEDSYSREEFLGFNEPTCAWVNRIVKINESPTLASEAEVSRSIGPELDQSGQVLALNQGDCRLVHLSDFKLIVAIDENFNTQKQRCAKPDSFAKGSVKTTDADCKVRNLKESEYKNYFALTDPVWTRDNSCDWDENNPDSHGNSAYPTCYRSIRNPNIMTYTNNKNQLLEVDDDHGMYMPNLSELRAAINTSENNETGYYPRTYYSDYLWITYSAVGRQKQFLIRPAIYRDGCNPYRYGSLPVTHCMTHPTEKQFSSCTGVIRSGW